MKLKKRAVAVMFAMLMLHMNAYAAVDLNFSNGLPSEVSGAVDVLDVDAYSVSKKLHLEKKTDDASVVGVTKNFSAFSGNVYFTFGMATSGTKVSVEISTNDDKAYEFSVKNGSFYSGETLLAEGVPVNEEFTVSLSGSAGGALAVKLNGKPVGRLPCLSSGSLREVKMYTNEANGTFDVYHLSGGGSSGVSFFCTEFKGENELADVAVTKGAADIVQIVNSERPAHLSVVKQDNQPEEDPKIAMSTHGAFKMTMEFSTYGMCTQRLRFEHNPNGLIYTDLFFEGERFSVWKKAGSPDQDTVEGNLTQNTRHTLVIFHNVASKTFDMLLDGKLVLQNRAPASESAEQIALLTFKLRNRSGWKGGGMNIYQLKIEDDFERTTTVTGAGFENENGSAVTAIDGNTLYGKYDVDNQNTEPFEGTLVMLYYVGDMLKKVNFAPVHVPALTHMSVRCSIDAPMAQDAAVYMLLWDDINGMKPMDDEASIIR